MARKKLILLDLGDVIWCECPAVQRIGELCVAHLGRAGIVLTKEDWFTAYVRSARRRRYGNRTIQTLLDLTGEERIALRIREEVRRDLSEMALESLASYHPLREEVPGILARLRRNYDLAVVSNQARRAAELMAFYGLQQYFDAILLSEEVGFEKPDKRIFELATKAFDACFDDVVMIGNRLDMDIVPATGLGFKTILYSCGKAIVRERSVLRNARADIYLDDLVLLEQVLVHLW